MACKGCKKTNKDSGKVKTVMVSEAFKLRMGIGFDQIGITNPTDENIIQFLKENPNRISLFESYPTDWKNNTKENK